MTVAFRKYESLYGQLLVRQHPDGLRLAAMSISIISSLLLSLTGLTASAATFVPQQDSAATGTSAPPADQNAGAPGTSPAGAAGGSDNPAAASTSGDAASTESTPGVKPAATGSASANGTPEYPADHKVAHRPIEVSITEQPYVVFVEVGFSGRGLLNPQIRQSLQADVATAVRRMYGRLWDADVRISAWLSPASEMRLQRLTVEDLTERYPSTQVDKVMFVSIEQIVETYTISVREFDTRIQELTPLLSGQTMDRRLCGAIAAQRMRDVFRPVLYLTEPADAGSDVLEFDLHGGRITPPDPSAVQMMDNDVLRPFVRKIDRRDRFLVTDLQRLPLEYIRVTEINRPLSSGAPSADEGLRPVEVEGGGEDEAWVDSGHVKGVMISHRPITTFGRRSRSSEQIAVRQRPAAPSSKVRLVLQKREDRPLICHRVDLVTKLRVRDENLQDSVRLISDRNGELEISVNEQHPTFWLYVYSGSILLARVPYAPGLVPQDTLELPDDSIRLSVEGELYLFRDDLVDGVAQRAVLLSLAKKASEANELDEFESTLKLLDEIPGKQAFDMRLATIRNTATERAKAIRNRSAEKRVDRLCDAMQKSLDEFFNSENQVKEREELNRLRQSIRPTSPSPPPQVPAAQMQGPLFPSVPVSRISTFLESSSHS
ncbi:MAG: hypothetical protein KDA85_20135 [Planctomycetaceae bacterium]|nr:hypothetical protein [Planctomycetaceae bacterium]